MVILGNLFSFCSAIFTILSSWQTTKRKIYEYQAIQCAFMVIVSIFLVSFSGATTFLLCAIRNFYVSRDEFDQKKYYIFLILIVAIGLLSNNRGYLGLIPIITTVIYTIGCYKLTDAKAIKYNIIINLLLWGFYELYILDYVSFCVDIGSAIIAFLSLFRKTKESY